MTASVLVATPTWMCGDGTAIRPETIASVNAQDCRDDFTWIVTVDNPWPAPDPRNVLPQYRRIRETFLQGDWAALVLLEHDNVLPDAGAIRRLLDTPVDVVYAPYRFRKGGLNIWQYVNQTNLGMPLTQHPAELAKARSAGMWRVSGAGFGCTLIRRHVVEAFPFRADGLSTSPDIPFALDCLRAGYTALANMTVEVGHYTAEGKLLMPFGEGGPMAIYEAVHTVNVMVSGRFIALHAGSRYGLTWEEASELLSVGFVKEVSELNADGEIKEVDNGSSGRGDEDVQATPGAGKVQRKSGIAKRS